MRKLLLVAPLIAGACNQPGVVIGELQDTLVLPAIPNRDLDLLFVIDDSPSMRFSTAMDLLLLLNVGGAKHTTASMTSRLSAAGLVIDDVRPVNAYLHAFDCHVPG